MSDYKFGRAKYFKYLSHMTEQEKYSITQEDLVMEFMDGIFLLNRPLLN